MDITNANSSCDSNVQQQEVIVDPALQYTPDELDVLIRCDYFNSELSLMLFQLNADGQTTVTLPHFPRKQLMDIVTGRSRARKKDSDSVLRGEALHLYLKSKLIVSARETDFLVGAVDFQYTTSLTLISDKLKEGLQILNNNNGRMLNASLAYGTWLEEAFNAYEYSKALGNIKGSWNAWLKENVSISAQYARQLRDLSKRFKTYKVLHYVGISLSEFYTRRLEVANMLKTNPAIAEYWTSFTQP